MSQIVIFLVVAVILVILGFVATKIGSNKNSTILIIFGMLFIASGLGASYLGYDYFMKIRNVYSIYSYQETDKDNYIVVLDGSVKTYLTVPKTELSNYGFVNLSIDKDGNTVYEWNTQVSLSRNEKNKFMTS